MVQNFLWQLGKRLRNVFDLIAQHVIYKRRARGREKRGYLLLSRFQQLVRPFFFDFLFQLAPKASHVLRLKGLLVLVILLWSSSPFRFQSGAKRRGFQQAFVRRRCFLRNYFGALRWWPWSKRIQAQGPSRALE